LNYVSGVKAQCNKARCKKSGFEVEGKNAIGVQVQESPGRRRA
jgi:hypothetical protein